MKNLGILDYGSDDSSILFQCPLTSLASITAIGGAEITNGSNSYDSILGTKAIATNGGIKFASMSGYANLDRAGQISFEIESAALCINNAVAPSSGQDWTGNNPFLTLRTIAGGTTPVNMFRLYMDASERLQTGQVINSVGGGGTSIGANTLDLSSTGKNQFCRVTISWSGMDYILYIDGKRIASGTRAGYPTTPFAERIDIVSGANTTLAALVGYYVRNLIVSNKPVMFSSDHRTRHIGILGHSFATRFKSTNTANLSTDTWRDSVGILSLEAQLQKRGLGCSFPRDYSTIQDVPGGEIRHAAGTTINSKRAASILNNCSIYLYMGGTNDVIQVNWASNKAQILLDIKDDITNLVAVQNFKLIVINNVISTRGNLVSLPISNTQADANVAEMNVMIDGLPAWFNSTFPTKANRLVVLDCWTKFGGVNPTPKLIQGLLRGTNDDSHPSGFGIDYLGILNADCIADNIKFAA